MSDRVVDDSNGTFPFFEADHRLVMLRRPNRPELFRNRVIGPLVDQLPADSCRRADRAGWVSDPVAAGIYPEYEHFDQPRSAGRQSMVALTHSAPPSSSPTA